MSLSVGLLCLASGCGGDSPESVGKASISMMNELAGVMESAKTFEEAKPKLEATVKKMNDLKKRMDDLKLSDAQKKTLETGPLKTDGEKAAGRMMKAMMELAAKDPLGAATMGEIMSKMKK